MSETILISGGFGYIGRRAYIDNSRAKKIIKWEPHSNFNDIVKSFIR